MTRIVPPDQCSFCRDDDVVEGICEQHLEELAKWSALHGRMMYGSDKKGRRYIERIPKDSTQN